MAPVNVLYLIRTWALGGSHTIVRLLMKHLPKDEFNIITVPYDAPGDGDERFIESVRRQGDDVAPERIPWKSRENWFQARARVAELIRKYDIQLIHCHDTHSNVLVGLGRRRWPCACIASPYGWWQAPWHVQAHVYHWVEKNLALPHFERVYTVSQDMKRKIMRGRTPESRIRVIHTGLDLAFLEQGQARETVRRASGFDAQQVVVGTVSRLFREKGHKYLLDALHLLRDEHPELRALIVGTGDQRTALETQARTLGMGDRVIFTGFYDDLPGALRAMDIFCQPSIDHEGFPTAVLEAQAAGLPVIASDIGGTVETIDPGVTGLLVRPANAAALAGALRQLVADPGRRQAMGAVARPWIERSFTLQAMISQMIQTYEEAMAEYRTGRRRT
ncbi:MAG: glycosyltransferase [Candidatus Hydrogenedentes bacterium]|nr:glycosyltransferase [Candidatus Hydrogenedentota bacterium]